MSEAQSWSMPLLQNTYIADGALSQYAVVLYGSEDNHCKAPAAAADAGICGVTQDAASASGDTVNVIKMGITPVIASEAISKGVEVAINDIEGRVKDPTVWTSGDGVVGTLEQEAAASGDIVACWLRIRTLLGAD
jgi:hypothetical protein